MAPNVPATGEPARAQGAAVDLVDEPLIFATAHLVGKELLPYEDEIRSGGAVETARLAPRHVRGRDSCRRCCVGAARALYSGLEAFRRVRLAFPEDLLPSCTDAATGGSAQLRRLP